jgi:hypothetical protein
MPARRIVRDVNEPARDMARRKMKTKDFLISRDQRKRVEMRFAHLKNHHGFGRMRLRGLSGARRISTQRRPIIGSSIIPARCTRSPILKPPNSAGSSNIPLRYDAKVNQEAEAEAANFFAADHQK